MREKKSDPKVIDLDDLQRRQFRAELILVLGFGMVALGALAMMQVASKSLDQVEELSDRVERLTTEQSEPPKTSPSLVREEPAKPSS